MPNSFENIGGSQELPEVEQQARQKLDEALEETRARAQSEGVRLLERVEYNQETGMVEIEILADDGNDASEDKKVVFSHSYERDQWMNDAGIFEQTREDIAKGYEGAKEGLKNREGKDEEMPMAA